MACGTRPLVSHSRDYLDYNFTLCFVQLLAIGVLKVCVLLYFAQFYKLRELFNALLSMAC